MVTFIPGEFNQSEFMRVRRVAGSSFGNLTKGDIIDFRYNGLYAVMDQRIELGTGDGSTKQFAFNSKEKFGTEYPLKTHRLKIIADHVLVASDNGNGAIAGTFMHGGESVVVSGTVDYATGVVSATFSMAPASGMPLHIGFDVDIEHAPNLIPRVDHRMAGTQAANIFRYLPAPLFVAAPGYRNIAQPHYVGKVFGQWDLYCDPQAENAYSCLGYSECAMRLLHAPAVRQKI